VVEAVLFDWGGTLAEWEWRPELLAAGHAAGFRAIGREYRPEETERFEAELMPLVEQEEYVSIVRRWLGDADDAEVRAFVAAEHEAWAPAHRLASTTQALLESLRDRGLKLGIVSNAFDPPELLHADLDRLGVAERVDVAVFASEAGVRKPDPAIYLRALDALGVGPEAALFVGDTLTDLAGAAALGMRTCQALWFNADEGDAIEADFRAFTQMDVLTVVKRLVSGS
jgi:putative hydrolase of the HAD superfamily